ncbi:unnamed protein product [Vitrella brassicaformis CCMP3155]|uniref:Peptidase M13 N-terminal domain-containing protein n=1 Tax=Vitrella brassicaformis (strain CCMP3155) TaxID=1169540 RepID=A0A0G4H367_VITBC|nr:unnamed protein product [Vitrella brassicaformis CCMP3155]|eukprot:CEM38163.1 unnamed protein product [Vitrella brassicaformis CCMP3155]
MAVRELFLCLLAGVILQRGISQVTSGDPPTNGEAEEVNGSPLSPLTEGVLSSMDLSADPCYDPDSFACGSWKESFELPAEEGSWTKSFDNLYNDTRYMILEVLESGICEALPDQENRTRAPKDGWEALLFCYFQACMNRDRQDELGTKPMIDFLQDSLPFVLQPSIEGWDDMTPKVAAEMLGKLQANGIRSLLSLSFEQNPITPENTTVIQLYQSGLNLDYTQYNENKTTEAYVAFLNGAQQLFQDALPSPSLRGVSSGRLSPAESAEASLAIEKDLQGIFLSPEEQRDVVKTTLPVTLGEMKQLAPNFDWDRFFEVYESEIDLNGIPITNDTEIVIHNRDYFRKLNTLLTEKWDDKALLSYFQSQLFNAAGAYLTREWADLWYTFRRDVYGVEPKQRWDECQSGSRAVMDWVVTRTILTDFDPQAKAVAEEMLANIKAAFNDTLDESTWMSDTTKSVAYEKLEKMTDKIAYPEWVLSDDYKTKLTKLYGPEDAARELDGQLFNASFYLARRGLNYLASFYGRAVDREVWDVTPIEQNAYYSPYYNEMVFLAGILQKPNFHSFNPDDPRNEVLAKKALNYGGLGGVMGHELTHGFDDQGAQYDADAKLRNWWSDQSKTKFEAATTCVADQFSEYVVLTPEDLPGETEDIKMNGRLTLGENVADLGGVKLARRALRKTLSEEDLQTRPLDGSDLTVEQLFWVAWGQNWCEIVRPKVAKSRLGTAVHSPGRFRSLGPVSNLVEFSDAFDCPADSVVNRQARGEECQVW